MSISLTAVQQAEYDAMVKAEYRSRGFRLRDKVRMKQNVTGSSVEFRKVGQIVASATAYQQAVTAQDPNYTKEIANIQKYTAPIAVDSVQELTVNFDSKMESALLVSDAMGRRSDQIIIDALNANPGDTIAAGGTNFTYDKFREVLEFFEDNAVPVNERCVAMSANNYRSLLSNPEFTSIDYTSQKALDTNVRREFLQFDIVIIPSMVEGGLPLSGSTRACFAWHKMSTGMGVGANFRTEINYIPEKTSWLVNGVFSCGATVIDNRGVLKIEAVES